MPDAARLVAALCLGVVAFVASGLVAPLMPDSTDFSWFREVNVALGMICGWVIMGKRAGRGLLPGVGNGLTGVAALVFWALFVQGCYDMLRLAMRHRYGGPFDALTDIFRIAADHAMAVMAPGVILFLGAGGVAAGLATEYARRAWR
ncbi:TrgA family protein [Pukyongiella litopenaei]|uniref:TrgA family protein n=1 Tax=Pukyongiella litopenaei TaxID=2605946 RepID=A0A2S0MR72_9RHOB|nr:TrgA family protein [Pukyongiella litopenaei]AVO38193.1 TrgA family protein [Pukyongiella litopenaei]